MVARRAVRRTCISPHTLICWRPAITAEGYVMRIDVHAHIFSKTYIDGLRRVFGNDNSPTGQDAQRLLPSLHLDEGWRDPLYFLR
jgi:hypothetical protein